MTVHVLGEKEYLYTSTLDCTWESFSGWWALVYDNGFNGGKQWCGIFINLLSILKSNVSLAIINVPLLWDWAILGKLAYLWHYHVVCWICAMVYSI